MSNEDDIDAVIFATQAALRQANGVEFPAWVDVWAKSAFANARRLLEDALLLMGKARGAVKDDL